MNRRHFLFSSAGLPLLSQLNHDPGDGLPEQPPPLPDEKYWKELRWHFFIPRGEAYCNTATLGSSPRCVVNAVHEHMRYVDTNVVASKYRGDNPHFLAGYQDEPTLRTRLAKIMGCTKEEVALTINSTMGSSYAAMGLDLEKGDEVVITDQEHPGGRSAYDVRAKRDGIVIREVKIPQPPNDPDQIVEAFASVISHQTRVLAISHMTSALGLLLPAKRIVQLCRERTKDCFVVLDGAQVMGHVPFDVRDLDCNAYVSSPHKWLLAPKGTGVMFIAKETSHRVWNTIASGQWSNQTDPGWRLSQIGTSNQSLHKGFEAVLDFLERIGLDVIHRRIKELGDRLRAGLQEIPGVTIKSSVHPDMCAGTTTYQVAGYTDEQVANALWKNDRIMPRPVGPGVRQSFHIYNLLDDVDRTLARIRKLADAKR